MSDDYFTVLADNATKTAKETQKVSSQVLTKNSGVIPKVFTVALSLYCYIWDLILLKLIQLLRIQ